MDQQFIQRVKSGHMAKAPAVIPGPFPLTDLWPACVRLGDAQLQNCCTLISPAGALVTPTMPPLSGLAASALPRAGAVFMQDWYFSEAVAMFPNARVMATMARRLEAPPVPSLIW